MHSDYKLKRQKELKGTYDVEIPAVQYFKKEPLADLTVILDSLQMLFSECKAALGAL